MDPKQYDLLHDDAVISDFAHRVRFPEMTNSLIKDYSLFVAKQVPSTKFEEGKVYLGTRACAEDAEGTTPAEYEESIVLYIEERFVNKEGQQCVTATKVYREILNRDLESDEATYVQIIYDHNLDTYSRIFVLEEIDGVETLLYNRQYSMGDFEEDLAGVRISANVEAELRGWWQIEDNWKIRLSNDPNMPF